VTWVPAAGRAMRRRGLPQPAGYQGQRRELARARKAAFARPPVRPDQVRQPGFSGYETTTGGTWRLAGVTDYVSKYEHGWRIWPACAGADATEAVTAAIAEAERPGGAPPARLLPARPDGTPVPIKLVTDNGPAFQGAAFAKFIASRPEPARIRTRANSPGHNGVRERAPGSLTYEHPYRHAGQIATLARLHRQAEPYRTIFNHIRPHEAPGMRRPTEIIRDPSLHPIHKNQTETLCQKPDARQDILRLQVHTARCSYERGRDVA
jgi:putative transposase